MVPAVRSPVVVARVTARLTDEERATLRWCVRRPHMWETTLVDHKLLRRLLDERDALAAEVERLRAAASVHRKSLFPASMGEHKGRHFCLACTTDVDDFVAYVDWPCAIGAALGESS